MPMLCSELNRRFGAPGRIVFRQSSSGAPVVALANQYGSAEVDLYGGRVLSYRPTGHAPVFFMPADCVPQGETWNHGGMPVCWPWFGKNGPEGAAGHGFARYQMFEVRGSEYSEEESSVTLGIKATADTRRLWPHEFDLELKVSVSMKLNVGLKTTNLGKEPFEITEGFHPYFLVRDRNKATVRGLYGCSFCDARESRVADRTWTGDLVVDTEYDHVFVLGGDGQHEHVLLDPGLSRAIAVVSKGNTKLVVWNPGPADCGGNMAPDDWRKFVCVEPATLFKEDSTTKIAPGESHSLLVAIQSVADRRGADALT